MGGLDLCWGRYDLHDHPIIEMPNSEKKYYFPFIDYSNARICDFTNVDNYLKESVPREECIRMPWHDVHTRLIGPIVGDIARHFVERWNHDNYENRNETTLNTLKASSNNGNKLKGSNIRKDGFLGQILESVREQYEKEEKSNKNDMDDIFNGNKTITEEEISNTLDLDDNYNISNKIKIAPIFTCQNNALKEVCNITLENNKENEIKTTNIFRNAQSEQKIGIRNSLKTKTIREEFDEKDQNKKTFWGKVLNKQGSKLKTSKTINYINNNSDFDKKKQEWMKNLKEIDEDHFLVPKQLNSMIISNSPPCSVQVLRSVGEWSLGLNVTENSILQAYYKLIEDSKYYIYIENQFFISKSFEGKTYLVENKIALYIRNRILRAVKNKEKFRVWVFIPLLPGFAGEPESSGTLQIILKYTYGGICRNNGLSIIEKLQEELEKIGANWEDYIGFYSLRNHGLFNGTPKTEIIYIHSKLMIIDDLYVLCGSANINDRSMKGSRDSEFAVLIKEKKTEISQMNNKKFKAAKFASSLRRALMAEHLGIKSKNEILVDPLSDNLHELIKKTAKQNTFTYRQIFGCYPDDIYTKFNMIPNNNIKNKAQEELLKNNYEENKNKIIGHIVEFPLHFLEEEELGISFFSKENLVPERNFT